MESIFFINCYKEKYPQKSKILMLGLATFELKYNITKKISAQTEKDVNEKEE